MTAQTMTFANCEMSQQFCSVLLNGRYYNFLNTRRSAFLSESLYLSESSDGLALWIYCQQIPKHKQASAFFLSYY